MVTEQGLVVMLCILDKLLLLYFNVLFQRRSRTESVAPPLDHTKIALLELLVLRREFLGLSVERLLDLKFNMKSGFRRGI